MINESVSILLFALLYIYQKAIKPTLTPYQNMKYHFKAYNYQFHYLVLRHPQLLHYLVK